MGLMEKGSAAVVGPRVSVVMAAYNGAEYLPAAIDSILNQTYGDFEFIIIDDGSTDETPDIIAGYTDPRVRPVANPGNLGLIASLNRGLELARGEFIARMDADDESLPNRFEEQVRFLDAHPEVGLLGTGIETFGSREEKWWVECDPANLRCRLLFETGFYHNTVMFRRSLVTEHRLFYDPAYPHAEDYELWLRFADVTGIANLPDVTVRYRLHSDSVSHSHRTVQQDTADRIRRLQLAKLGIRPNELQLKIHSNLMRGAPHTLEFNVDDVEAWIVALLEGNRQTGYCDQSKLNGLLYETWFKLCRSHRSRLSSPWWRFASSPLTHGMPWPNRFADTVRLFLVSRG